MHEASLVEALIEVIETEAANAGMVRVTGLKLRVGAMRMVVPEMMQTAFEIMSKGSVAEGARMQIEEVPLLAHCTNCNRDVEVDGHVFLCTLCGTALSEILSGQELDLMEITGDPGESS
jgi:hydrogenase nickel incorporation protein HypA/HybF